MVIIRLTSSLAKKMNLKLTDTQLDSTSKLGDWYASDFRLGTKHLILCTSTIGRWPIIINAAPYKNFPSRLITELKPSLLRLGISEDDVNLELAQFNEISYAKNIDRSLIGQMVDSIKMCEAYYEGNIRNLDSLGWISEKLAEVPHMSKVKGWPEDMTRDAFKKTHLRLL